MLTYEYECEACGLRFERMQSIMEEPVAECPECRGKVRRLVSGGGGFLLKGSGGGRPARPGDGCSGGTCCGLDGPCGNPPCVDDP
jgi:putative FmdB family regulatory protein